MSTLNRWVTSEVIPFDLWHRETRIGLTRCGMALNLDAMLTTLAQPLSHRTCHPCENAHKRHAEAVTTMSEAGRLTA